MGSALPPSHRLMLGNCWAQCSRIFIHLQKLLQYHQLQWREVPAMALYFEVGVGMMQGSPWGDVGLSPLPRADRHSSQMWSCRGHRKDDTRTEKIFRKYIHSERRESRELALRGLQNLYAGRMQLLLPDVLLWLQDVRADVKLQATCLLQDILAQHPASIRGVLSQLAVQLLSCFNEVRVAGQQGAPNILRTVQSSAPLPMCVPFQDNAEVRWRSMELFALLLEAPGRKQLLPQAERSLVPLFIHMNEDIPNVAQVGAAHGITGSWGSPGVTAAHPADSLLCECWERPLRSAGLTSNPPPHPAIQSS